VGQMLVCTNVGCAILWYLFLLLLAKTLYYVFWYLWLFKPSHSLLFGKYLCWNCLLWIEPPCFIFAKLAKVAYICGLFAQFP